MVKFKGQSSLKQFQPAKPIKRGFKVWCRADSITGYIDNFVVHTGKSDEGPTKNLGYKVVMEVCKSYFGERLPCLLLHHLHAAIRKNPVTSFT